MRVRCLVQELKATILTRAQTPNHSIQSSVCLNWAIATPIHSANGHMLLLQFCCFVSQTLFGNFIYIILTTVIGCKGLIIVRRRMLLASEQAPLLSPLRTLSLKNKMLN